MRSRHAAHKRRLSYGPDLGARAPPNYNILEERDPSLITLPFPIPSIPLLGPLLSPLIAGTSPTSTSKSSAVAPTPTPAPTGSSSGSGNSGNSGNGGSSGGSSSGGSSGSGSTDPGGGTGDSGGGTGSGASNSNPNSGEQSTSSGAAPVQANASAPSNAASIGGSTAVGASSAAPAASGASINNANNSLSNASGSPAATVNATPASGSSLAAQQTLINVGGGSTYVTVVDGTSTRTVAGALATGTQASTATTGSSGGGGGSNSNSGSGTDGGDTTSAANKHSGLSSGAIAGIVLALLLFFLCLAVFIFRKRRARARRNSAAPLDAAQGYAGYGTADNTNRASAISLGADPFADPRPRLEMAYVARAPAALVLDRDPFSNAHRVSVASSSSSGSGEGEMLVPNGENGENGRRESMSVRPFSPSESFAFPRPPGSEWGSSVPASVVNLDGGEENGSWRAESVGTLPLSVSTYSNPFGDDVSGEEEVRHEGKVGRGD